MKRVSKKKQITVMLAIIIVLIVIYLVLSFLNQGKSNISKDAIALNDTNDSAYDFAVYDADDNTVTISDKLGKPIFINFWASWCEPNAAELGYIQTAYEKYGDQIEFMEINLTDGEKETKEIAVAFLEENNYTFPVYFDKDYNSVKTYGFTNIPVSIFIDEKGNMTSFRQGAMTEDVLNSSLEDLLAQ